MSPQPLVIDASAVVEVLRGTALGDRVAEEMRGSSLAAPAHLDAEVLSAIGRLARASTLTEPVVEHALVQLERLPVERYPLSPWSGGHGRCATTSRFATGSMSRVPKPSALR